MSQTSSSSRVRYKRVILVEDDLDTLRVMGKLLERVPVVAVSASDCAGALRAAGELGGIDLLITDLSLPDGTGLQLASTFRQHCGCRTIVVSGSPAAHALPEYVAMWLTKPVEFGRLREAVLAMVA